MVLFLTQNWGGNIVGRTIKKLSMLYLTSFLCMGGFTYDSILSCFACCSQYVVSYKVYCTVCYRTWFVYVRCTVGQYQCKNVQLLTKILLFFIIPRYFGIGLRGSVI